MGEWVAMQDYAHKRGIPEQDVWAQVQGGQLMHRELAGVIYVYARDERTPTSLATAATTVPMYYAERSMGTIMQLHDELMAEKERCVDLHRRLMSREQAYSELEYYARLLEAKLEGRFPEVHRPERLADVLPIRPDLNVAPPPRPARVDLGESPNPYRQTWVGPPEGSESVDSERAAVGTRPDGWRCW